MSKTVEIQIEKSRGLVEGLRRHVKEMGERGVTNDEINAMEQAVKELEAVNAEVDSIREQLAPKVAKLKVAMDCVKEAYAEKKRIPSFECTIVNKICNFALANRSYKLCHYLPEHIHLSKAPAG